MTVQRVLWPDAVAILGASSNPSKAGYLPLRYLRAHGFAGKVYATSRRQGVIEGVTCVPSLRAVPDHVDLAVSLLRPTDLAAELKCLPPGKIGALLVVSSGYAEAPGDGARAQRELVGLARESGIDLLMGPNSVGSANLWNGALPTISQAFEVEIPAGEVAVVTQSGAVGTAIVAELAGAGIGVGYMVSTGNEAGLEIADVLMDFATDDRVRIVVGFVEAPRDGRKLAAALRRLRAAGKRVALMAPCSSTALQEAIAAHSARLAGSGELYGSILGSAGAILVTSIEELVDVTRWLDASSTPRVGHRAGVLSHSGGLGVILTDACERAGLAVPPFSPGLRAQLAKHVPPFAALRNPVDATAQAVLHPDQLVACARQILQSAEVDILLIGLNILRSGGPGFVENLVAAHKEFPRPLAVSWIAGADGLVARLQAAGIPTYPDPTRCVRAVSLALSPKAGEPRAEAPRTAGTRSQSRGAGRSLLEWTGGQPSDYEQVRQALAAVGVPVCAGRVVWTPDEAAAALEEFGAPVVAKLASPTMHKAGIGGVVAGIATASALSDAISRLRELPLPDGTPPVGVLVQPQVHQGVEAFVGAHWDRTFGPVVTVGMGGTGVEVHRQIDAALAPAQRPEIVAALQRSAWGRWLSGDGGEPSRDVEALVDLVQNVSQWFPTSPLRSLDLNPVMVLPRGRGVTVVDIRVFYSTTPEIG